MSLVNWLAIAGVAFLVGAFMNIKELTWMAGAIALLVMVVNFWKRRALSGVRYTRKFHYRRGFPGESSNVQITLENDKWLPLSWLRTSDLWPLAAATTKIDLLKPSSIPSFGTLVNLFSPASRQRIRRNFDFIFRQRGVHHVGPVTLESGDLFGLYSTSQTMERTEQLTVFPQLLPFSMLKLQTDDPFGDLSARKRLFEDPNRPMGVRSYHPEDEFRRIHWPATARTGSLQVKIYQPVSAQVMVVCLNMTTSSKPWLGLNQDMLEELIKVSATVVYESFQSGYAVGLLSNGYLSHSDIPFKISPGRNPEQLANLLQALAAVTPYTNAPFESYLIQSLPQLSYGATLVIITAIVTPELLESLVKLRRYRAHTTLISLDRNPPPDLPWMRVVHLPFESRSITESER